MRVPSAPDGRIRVQVPDDVLRVDFDPITDIAIPAGQRLQPGVLEIRLIGEVNVEGVAGSTGPGVRIEEPRRFTSNVALMQLVPRVTSVAPASGTSATILHVTGTRLWHGNAREAQVVIGDAAVAIRAPAVAGAWADPTPTAVEVPVAEAGLADLAPTDPPYRVAVMVDGARSRETTFGFRQGP
jgi:hypothetical protein